MPNGLPALTVRSSATAITFLYGCDGALNRQAVIQPDQRHHVTGHGHQLQAAALMSLGVV